MDVLPSKLVKFIDEAFESNGMAGQKIDDAQDWVHSITIYRNHEIEHSLFTLLDIGHDPRESYWRIELSVGKGFPENASDPVEFQLSSISLSELGFLKNDEVSYLPLSVDEKILQEMLVKEVHYCIDFMSGKYEHALSERNKRNLGKIIDPLGLNSKETKELYGEDEVKFQNFVSALAGRNDELRNLLKKYVSM